MPEQSLYTQVIVPKGPPTKFSFDSVVEDMAVTEFKVIEIGPFPKLRNLEAEKLIIDAARVLGKKPEEIFVGRKAWPFGVDSFDKQRPCFYAQVMFYLTPDIADFFAFL